MTQATPACARPTKKFPEGRTGTSAGYGAHRSAGEDACAACVAAHSARGKARRIQLAEQGVDVNVYNRKHYQANREALNEQRRTAYREDPAKSIARTRKWALKNPEKTKEIGRRYESANRETRLAKHREWVSKNPEKAKASRVSKAVVIREAKNRPCQDCGIQYPYYVMQFDHREPAKKLFTIGNRGALKTLEVLKAEIAKCDVVCANCHMERTHGPSGRQRRHHAEQA